MVNLPVDKKLEGSPYHCEIVIDAHQRIMNSFLDACGSRCSHSVRKLFKRHPDRFAFAHQYHRAAGEQRFLDRLRIAFRHAIKKCPHRSQNRLFFLRSGGQRSCSWKAETEAENYGQ